MLRTVVEIGPDAHGALVTKFAVTSLPGPLVRPEVAELRVLPLETGLAVELLPAAAPDEADGALWRLDYFFVAGHQLFFLSRASSASLSKFAYRGSSSPIMVGVYNALIAGSIISIRRTRASSPFMLRRD